MSATDSKNIGIKLCEVFGLDPKKVVSLSINVRSDEIVYLEVTQVTHQAEMKQLVELMKEYKLERTDTTSEIKGTNIAEFNTFEK